MTLTKAERKRRDEANARRREKMRKLRHRGLCLCGAKLDKNPRTGRNYTYCPPCREKWNAYANERYASGPKGKPPRTDPKLDPDLHDSTGVRRRLERDGMGRTAWWWVVNAYVWGKQKSRRFSVDKYGDRGAHKLALRQRQQWEKEMMT